MSACRGALARNPGLAPDRDARRARGSRMAGRHACRRARRRAAAAGHAPFDLMVDDVDAAYRDYAEKGLKPTEIRRGRIHDSFELPGPDGWTFTVNSSHASGEP